MRLVLIELVGLRRIDTVPALIKAADDSNAQIRAAALTALGSTVGPGDLSVLITRVATPTNSVDTAAAQQALRAACVRMPDRDACAAQLTAAMPRANVSAKRAILETLASVGGTRALRSVAIAAEAKQPELQDTATRLLGQWMLALPHRVRSLCACDPTSRPNCTARPSRNSSRCQDRRRPAPRARRAIRSCGADIAPTRAATGPRSPRVGHREE